MSPTQENTAADMHVFSRRANGMFESASTPTEDNPDLCQKLEEALRAVLTSEGGESEASAAKSVETMLEEGLQRLYVLVGKHPEIEELRQLYADQLYLLLSLQRMRPLDSTLVLQEINDANYKKIFDKYRAVLDLCCTEKKFIHQLSLYMKINRSTIERSLREETEPHKSTLAKFIALCGIPSVEEFLEESNESIATRLNARIYPVEGSISRMPLIRKSV